ncbi:MAG: P1 family peptidase [Acidimicrobiales bacterium]
MSGVDLGVDGVLVGHWSDPVARTGCTVVRLPPGNVASGEVRGGAPATRELDLLVPGRLVRHVDAVVLTGGSAFGLAAADGVARACEAEGIGFPTGSGPVPIVVCMAIYDLAVGDPAVRPGPEQGAAAWRAALPGQVATGAVGAGTGATVGKWRGPDGIVPGGLGVATATHGDLTVSALVVVNAAGDVVPAATEPADDLQCLAGAGADPGLGTNTTVGVVVTNARLDELGCLAAAQGAHDGLARAIHPPHLSVDGDAVVAAATGEVDASPDQVRTLAVLAFAAAIRQSVER